MTHDGEASSVSLCQIDGCTRPASRRGWCRAHYARWERYRDPLGGKKFESKHPLSERLHELADIFDLSRKELSVLSEDHDPYRIDKDSNHRNGEWLRKQMEACNLIRPDGTFERKIHNRGIHYAVYMHGSIRPDNQQPFLNDDENWGFLEKASKAARWLGYVPWEAIFDARSSAPVIQVREPRLPARLPSTGVCGFDFDALSELQNIDFSATVWGSDEFQAPQQPYRLVIWGEKTSLDPALRPLANQYGADLYLTIGEPSESQLHLMAKTGAEDGREMIVFTFSDADPSGYQMPVSIAHKLRAFRDSVFPKLRFRLIPVALTVEQVRELGLPSNPIKETEKRGKGWRAKYGIEQTEVDSLSTLKPNVFRQIARDAISPYYDATLARRVRSAQTDWQIATHRILKKALEGSGFDEARDKAEEEISKLADELINKIEGREQELDSLVQELCPAEDLPPIEIPQAELDEPPAPFISSKMDLLDHIRKLRKRKDYSGG